MEMATSGDSFDNEEEEDVMLAGVLFELGKKQLEELQFTNGDN